MAGSSDKGLAQRDASTRHFSNVKGGRCPAFTCAMSTGVIGSMAGGSGDDPSCPSLELGKVGGPCGSIIIIEECPEKACTTATVSVAVVSREKNERNR